MGVKRPGCETENSFPSSAEVKNVWSYTSAASVRLHGSRNGQGGCGSTHSQTVLNDLKMRYQWSDYLVGKGKSFL
jgi:hypothetical protein